RWVHAVRLRDGFPEADVILVPSGIVPRLVVAAGRAEHRRVTLLFAHHDRVGQSVADVGNPPHLFDRCVDGHRCAGIEPLRDEHAVFTSAGHVPAAVARIVAAATVRVELWLPSRWAVEDLNCRLGYGAIGGVPVDVILFDERRDGVHPGPADAG